MPWLKRWLRLCRGKVLLISCRRTNIGRMQGTVLLQVHLQTGSNGDTSQEAGLRFHVPQRTGISL